MMTGSLPRTTLPILLLLLLLLTAPVRESHAQSSYAPADPAAPFSRIPVFDMSSNHIGVSIVKNIGLSLQRKPEFEPGYFALNVAASMPVHGCYQISDIEYTTEFKDIFLDIEIVRFRALIEDPPSAPQYECDQRAQLPGAEIVLNKDMLKEKGTKHIRFHTDPFIDYYDIDVTDERVRLIPTDAENQGVWRFVPKQIYKINNTLTHWFYPEGTLILSVPDAEKKHDIEGRIMALAESKGLVTLQSIYTDFKSPIVLPHHYYYVDKEKHFTDAPDIAQGALLGSIFVEKTVFGLDADEQVLDEIRVLVRTPGTYE